MQRYSAALSLVLIVSLVIIRARQLKTQGIDAFHFGKLDRKDLLIPPFAFFYFYQVAAFLFDLPNFPIPRLFESTVLSWVGVLFCAGGVALFAAGLVSFRNSFRVGIDTAHPDRLITGGVFAFTRNPIYVAFWSVFLGMFLVFPTPVFALYFLASLWLIHRQVLREEKFLDEQYGQEYTVYRNRVRRYL